MNVSVCFLYGRPLMNRLGSNLDTRLSGISSERLANLTFHIKEKKKIKLGAHLLNK